MAILTESGRIAVAQYISDQPLHMAWGNGSASWDATPVPPNVDDLSLVSEVGRLKATAIQFATPSSTGAIELPEGKLDISATATKYLLLTFEFSFTHAVGEDIREMGVFVGTTLKSGVPPDTPYLLPAQVNSPGRMMVVERVVKFTRVSNIKQKFTYVIQF